MLPAVAGSDPVVRCWEVPAQAGDLLAVLFPHLSGLRVSQVADTGEAVILRASVRGDRARCPWCGQLSARVHGRYQRAGAGDSDAAPNRRRRIGHRAHDRGRAKMPRETRQRLASDYRYKDSGGARPAAVAGHDIVDDLGFYGKHHRGRRQIARQRLDCRVPGDALRRIEGRRTGRLDHQEPGCRFCGDPAAQHRRPHFPASHKNEGSLARAAITHSKWSLAQASPTGSIIAEAIAWAGDFPPQTTN